MSTLPLYLGSCRKVIHKSVKTNNSMSKLSWNKIYRLRLCAGRVSVRGLDFSFVAGGVGCRPDQCGACRDFAFSDTHFVKALLAMLSALRSKHAPFAVRLGRQERRRIKEYTKPTRTRAKGTERTDLHKKHHSLFFCCI